MHLLTATSGVIGDGEEAVDLDQAPASMIFLSGADSELAALSHAHALLGAGAEPLRLTPLLALRHNMSVDLWIEKTARHARLIVARILGGRAYWPYGVDELRALALREGIHLVLLPGGGVVDEELSALSTVPAEACEAIRRLLAAGGVENARAALGFATDLLRGKACTPPPARPLPAAGLWLNGRMEPAPRAARQVLAQGPAALLVFYRALIEGGFTAPVETLAEELRRRGLAPLPVFVASLKDPAARTFLADLLAHGAPQVIINATAFSAGAEDPLRAAASPVLQAIFSSSSRDAWTENPQGLSPRDLAMHVALPELDGRIITRAVSFKQDDHFDAATQCNIVTYAADAERTAWLAELAARWQRLRATPARDRRIAIVLANYPNRDARLGNGVGYDTPASTIAILRAMKEAGYDVRGIPADGNALIARLRAGPTNAAPRRSGEWFLSEAAYARYFNGLDEDLKKAIRQRWGHWRDDPSFRNGAFAIAAVAFGKVVCAIQPARGYNIDPRATYHDPALPPPHGYLAFYLWLRESFGALAVIHNGKHGNLEWLPGKALALSRGCFPDAALGPLPQLYPFIVNDPGEGAQAKRRTAAVIIDHLMPPLARAGTYGNLAELERLMDEYAQAAGLDGRRLVMLRKEIFALAHGAGMAADAGLSGEDSEDDLLRLDSWLCEIKESQIRNGLHILGSLPEGEELAETLVSLVRLPRGEGAGRDASLICALAEDLLPGFDPFDGDMAAPWEGPHPQALATAGQGPWRTAADARERLELLALRLVQELLAATGDADGHDDGKDGEGMNGGRGAIAAQLAQARCTAGARTAAVLEWMAQELLPLLRRSVRDEIGNLLKGLDGGFVPPGPSGAPSRGRLDVLPTGRNFFSLDARALPTPAAWRLGRASAENMVLRHFQEHGAWPRALGLSMWGTANMRTGGDDIAQALALIGVRPVWDHPSGRVTGFEVIPLAELGRPRVDVTVRVSGFFRDAFPLQMELFSRAVRAVAGLDETEEDNPLAAAVRRETARLAAAGTDAGRARRLACYRVFGSRPGAYGAGLQALFDERLWRDRGDLAESYINWGAHAYDEGAGGERAEEAFRNRLSRLDAVAHNQDNREHDLLDSDDYYQFEGGMAAAAGHLQGRQVPVWHNDHSRPERPVTRSLEEEVSRVMRARVVNPKWISAMMRHGYKGAFEIAATVDYMFAFAATTGAVKSHHFDLAFDAFIADEEVRRWLEENNDAALRDIRERFAEAMARGMWRPRRNSAAALLEEE